MKMTFNYDFGNDEYEYTPDNGELLWQAVKLWCEDTMPQETILKIKQCGAYRDVLESMYALMKGFDADEELCERYREELWDVFYEYAEKEFYEQ